MVYVKFHYETNLYDCDCDEYMEFEEGEYTEADLTEMLYEGAYMNAEQYADQMDFDEEEDLEDLDDYYDYAYRNSYWEYVDEKEYMENTYEE